VHRRTKLLADHHVVDEYPRDVHNTFVGALASLATHHESWLRPVAAWHRELRRGLVTGDHA